MFFKWLKIGAARKNAAKGLYQTTLIQSREPVFYTDLGVPDTMDGRFDLLAFHAAAVMNRLSGLGQEGLKLSQAYFDALFIQVDFALRESGVGDLGVPKHMAKMMKAFNGRIYAYHEAFVQNDMNIMELAVARNVYRKDSVDDNARAMAAYGFNMSDVLKNYDLLDFQSGRMAFPDLRSPDKARKVANG